ncbi:MAG: hypothetical protein GON13_02055 [Nanoarchaeota archaeon]|nr:hypothetical protein [Nanoarchaeota archaeon]
MDKRIHVIPLRRECNKVSIWKRSNKAIKALKDYVKKHYRTDNLVIGKDLNELIWSRGNKNPPSKIKVVAVKADDKVSLYLEENYKEEKKVEKKVEKVKGEVVKDVKKVEEKVEEKKEELKKKVVKKEVVKKKIVKKK